MRPIIERIGGEDAIRQKVTVVEGDLDQPLCGLALDRIAQLKGKVDIVVNLAGLVDFAIAFAVLLGLMWYYGITPNAARLGSIST